MDQAPGAGTPGTVTTGGAAVAAASVDLQRDLAQLGLEDVAELASGGFATVYRASQPAMGREVAVKVLTAPVTDSLVRSRFARECRALGLLSDHPAIVTVFDEGFTGSGRPYLVMELMTGGSFADRLETQGPLEWPDVLTIGVRIAGALHSAHHHGVLHRDVKPANVLVSSYGAPKLGDFGIARLQGAEHTRTGALTGSLAHAAPELLGGAAPSERSDVYALGSTLFTLLHGETAFLYATDESVIPALARITSSPIPDLRDEGVPDEVCAAVEQLMAKRPDARPQSAAEAGRLLQQAQQSLQVPVTVLAVPDDRNAPVLDPGMTRRHPPPAPAASDSLRPPLAPPPAADTPRRASRRSVTALLGVVTLAALAAAVVFLRPAPQPASSSASAQSGPPRAIPLDVTATAEQIGEIRGIPATPAPTAAVLPRGAFDEQIRAWAIAGREQELRDEQRVLSALRLVPADLDLLDVTQDLAAEQFLGFADGTSIAVRGETAELSPLQRSVVADEIAGVLLDQRHEVAGRAPQTPDRDQRRAWDALHKGDTAVTAAAWNERFLTTAEQDRRATELSAQPDRIGRGLPDALRGDLVFPYVAGEEFVRTLFADGGVAAIDRAYAEPPVTTEQLLHPEKYRSREPAMAVRLPQDAPQGWTQLSEQTFGEFDLQRMTAVLGSERSDAAAAGWGGGRLRAWERGGDVAVRVALVFDSTTDAREACTAVRAAHLARTDAVPAAPDVLVTPTDALVLRCDGSAVDLAVAPDRATATAVVGL